ncbi:hypothetical protein [Cellulomonas sp. ATA003]|uniref:hypothetical protein n=1 Tax=Cellulomonas sp. ATA003 TaxID=3073064 RepID=UPI002872CB30|nr:hypothetical protein [Cellulomonas sp. ATA003]WNB86445.1 hypothetical protein REH70_04185 [Cellulomonas sp. ATA003]
MPNDDNPVAAAEEAAQAMRALAHATRRFDDPADTYWAMGNILAIATRFSQVLEQVAQAHRDNLQAAHDDNGHRTAGRALGLSAAQHLHQAAIMQGEALHRLDLAAQSSGQIAWYADDPATRTPVALVTGPTVASERSSRPIRHVSEPSL